MEVKITERGWAGHYICSNDCLFTRNTLIEYKNTKWIVSTVGNKYVNNKLETIGWHRYYETRAFEGRDENGYIECNVNHRIPVESITTMEADNVDKLKKKYGKCYDNYANAMHDVVVDELKEKIVKWTDNDGKYNLVCDVCDTVYDKYSDYKYCPECGARLEKVFV